MLTINIDASDLKRLIRQVDAMRAKIPQAIARGLNEGGNKVRTQVQHALQRQAGFVKYSSVTSRVRTAGAFGEGKAPASGIGPTRDASLEYVMYVSGKPSKPREFKYAVKRGPGGGVTVWMWGVAHRFPRSFQIAGETGPAGLKMRLGKPREPIRGFDGPNLARECLKDQAAEAFFKTTEAVVVPAIEKHLARTLGGG